MKLTRKLILGVALLASVAPAEAARRINALFLGQKASHHDSAERYYDLITRVGQRGINVDYTDTLSSLSPEGLKPYDALIIYANWDKIDTKEQEKALLSFAREEGKGIVILHCGSYCFRNSLEFVRLTGGQFMKHETGEFDTTITAPEHPIMKGFAPFRTWDETYVHTAHNDESRTILQKRGDEPYTWVRDEGKGRVFYTAYGHDQRTWLQSSFCDLVYRGIKWSAGDAVAQQHTDLKLANFLYVDDAKVPNYEKREPAPQLQEPMTVTGSTGHMATPAQLDFALAASEESQIGLWNVIDFKFDERGRVWTCESIDYPNEIKLQGEGRDRIRVLEDTDGDGKLDKATVFADKLSIPSSLVFAQGGVIVVAMPDTYLFTDTNGDDVADDKKVLFTGWGTNDTHATVSSLHYGHDNWVYGTVGYAGFNGTVGGVAHKFSQAAFRFLPDGSKLEMLGRTSNNTWGLGLNENGDLFGSTANNQHSWYIAIPRSYYDAVDGLDMGITPGIESVESKRMAIVRPYVRQVDVFNQRERDFTWGFTAAASHTVYSDRAFPQEYWNHAAFVCEPTGHLVSRGWLKQTGTDFSFERGWNLIASPDEWFAPVHTEVAPDGSVWVSDFYSFLIQHNPTPSPTRGGFQASTGKGNAFVSDLRDTEHARLWRVMPKGVTLKKPNSLSVKNIDGLVSGLQSSNMNTRLHAQRLLIQSGSQEVKPKLEKLVAAETVDAVGIAGGSLHALWTLQGLKCLDEAVSVVALKHPASGVRRAALKTLPRTAANAEKALVLALKDAEPLVRLTALLVLTEMPASETIGATLASLANEDIVKKDKYLPIALTMAGARHSLGYLKATLAAAPVATEADKAPASEGANLFPNPNFEKIENGLPMGWKSNEYTGKADFSVGEGRFGGKALAINSKDGCDGSWNTTLALEPNTDYIWTAYIKTDRLETLRGGKGAQIEIDQLNGAQPTTRPLKGTQDWTKRELKFSTGKQTKGTFNLLYGGWGHATGLAVWDDVSLVKLGPSGNAAAGFVDLGAVARAFAKTADATALGALHQAIGAKTSAASRTIAAALAAGSTVAPAAAMEDAATLAKTHQVFTVKSVEGLQFDIKELTAVANKPIAIIFENPDLLQHNLLVGAPDSLEKIGNAANAMAADPAGVSKGYVPALSEVIGSSGLLNNGEKKVIKLSGLKPGAYPYLCTFPGHWILMKGILTVK
jgi:uncharacterized protein